MNNNLNIHNYATNGKSGGVQNIKATKIKSANKENQTTNGKIFKKSYKDQLLYKNIISDIRKTNKKDFVSWIADTLNPINHIPVINTLKNLNKDKQSSLDMVQSAIGGIIYGGGVIGIAKGLSGWFAGKLFPKNIITTDNKIEKNKNLIPMNNGKVTYNNNSMQQKVSFKKTDFQNIITDDDKINEFNNSTKIDIIHFKKNNKNYYDLDNKSKKIISRTLDTKA